MPHPDANDQYEKLPDPLEKSAYAATQFYRACRRAMSHFDVTRTERDEFLVLMGMRGATERLLASNERLRLQSTKILHRQFSKLRNESLAAPKRRFWHVSFLGPLINEYRPDRCGCLSAGC